MSPKKLNKAGQRRAPARGKPPAKKRAAGKAVGRTASGRTPAGDGPVRAWVATADMGLGHQRAAYPLRDIAEGGLMTLGTADSTSASEHKLWERLRKSYEFLSRTKSWWLIGNAVFGLLDRLQNIPPSTPCATSQTRPSPCGGSRD
jgi:hypothetical protein